MKVGSLVSMYIALDPCGIEGADLATTEVATTSPPEIATTDICTTWKTGSSYIMQNRSSVHHQYGKILQHKKWEVGTTDQTGNSYIMANRTCLRQKFDNFKKRPNCSCRK